MAGRVVPPPRAAESKGRQNEEIKISIFCAHQILNYWATQREIQEMLFFTIHNFCKERTF